MKRGKGNKGQRPTNGVTTLSIKPPAMRPSVVESEVVVPLAWSLLLATSLGLAAMLAVVALREVLDGGWEWWVAAAAGGCVWVVVFAWRVVVCEADRRSLLLYPMEVGLGRDLDGDGYVGEPGPQVEVVEEGQDPRLIYVHNAYRQQHEQDAGDFRHFLKVVYDGGTTAWRTWENEPLPSGRRVTQPLWEMWCGRLKTSGLASRPYPTAPLALAGDYRQALETFRELL
jgi:hypothetical protein